MRVILYICQISAYHAEYIEINKTAIISLKLHCVINIIWFDNIMTFQ